MNEESLARLAHAAGVSPRWNDVFGRTHEVAPQTLRLVLAALDLPANTKAETEDSYRLLMQPAPSLPSLVTGQVGEAVHVPARPGRYRLVLEDGRKFEGVSETALRGATIPAILEHGYHHLEHDGQETTLAIAPPRCFTIPEALGNARGWGLAVQLYSLRRDGDAGIGSLSALADFAREAARRGASALAISPMHAQFSADPDRFSPYAPSSRTALNVLHSTIGATFQNDRTLNAEAEHLERLSLIDWPAASRFRLDRLREIIDLSLRDPDFQRGFAEFKTRRGDMLASHAIFETLHAHFFRRDHTRWHWRTWPGAYQNPASPEVAAFADAHAREVEFHAAMQFLADCGLRDAQRAARGAGMAIGLVSDLAVGADSGGSQCWGRQQETLLGLTVGAPPDLLQRQGQNWGLTAFSPRGLVRSGFSAYREMLETALAHAGGMRVDHAMGLNRLWVIPEGADGADGAYLSFPERDLLRLVALESVRRRAIVIAEDLGTVPEGFSDRLREAGIGGMRILWFERDEAQGFKPPSHWSSRAAAMTSTHDLPTVAGWWSERDIDWREKLGSGTDTALEREERARDRALLWATMRESGAATGDPPDPLDGAAAADAACAHVARSACELAMIPLEDALALVEQPNLPGTLDEHPNWRRRLPASSEILLADDAVARRLQQLDIHRQQQ